MSSFSVLAINNSLLVYFIDPHFSRGMNDLSRAQQYPHVSYFIFPFKESKVAALGFFQFFHFHSLSHLLLCITQKIKTHHFKDHLGKTAAIHSKRSSSSP